MGLLSGGGASILQSVFAPIYLNGRIFQTETVFDAYGEITTTYAEFDAKMQVDSMTEAMRQQEGASEQDRRIIVLSNSTSADINTDAEVICDEGPYAGIRFQVATINRDPCGAYHELRGRRAS